MEDDGDAREAEGYVEGRPSRVLRAVGHVGLVVALVTHALRGRWVAAAFFLVTVLLFLTGRRADGWPKAARVVFVVVYAALAVAMFVELTRDLKASV
ncbi:MAG TPA: hypothetical protein VF659_04585 [Pyrinomonadaceae bacterium]|jgi:phosphoglycerol transferase MdoB-like AlkP superfamily enzyme